MVDKNVWTQKHEPKNMDDMVLHPVIRNKLENVLREPKNLILYGTSGVGKGTFKNIYMSETAADFIAINASDETGIDLIRVKVKTFAIAASPYTFYDRGDDIQIKKFEKFKHLKVVIFNEAENLSIKAQASLRDLMETQEHLCKFLFMTNDIAKIDSAIKSRCALIEIKDPPKFDMIRFMERILTLEGICFEQGILETFVQDYYPDMRRIIKEIQVNCKNNELQSGNITAIDESLNKVLLDLRLHMAYFNIDKKEIHDQLSSQVDLQISQRQFYDLIRNNNTNKVSVRKKAEFINIVKESIPLKEWYYEYMSLKE